ncbi:MAG: nucleotide exchange factor GrpE [Candidatus Peribacteraceae bacterium]|jgi:molecular chaperone GrpE
MNPAKKKSHAASAQPKGTQKECTECARLQAELTKFKELAGRAQADLQNAKDRLQREAQDMRKYALENTLLQLLPTVDNFQRAFAHLPPDLQDHEWVKGVSAIEQELIRNLQTMGLTKIECIGQPVDHTQHEVLQVGPGQEGMVTQVFEDGYMFNGKVLRPAKVQVGQGS